MHSLVRRFLKTGIVFLVVGLLLGLWMMVQRELGGRASGPYAVSAHTHAILVGFVMMMILGVALWLFPRPAKDDTRYTPRAAEGAYWLVTTGTAARVVGELMRPDVPARWLHRDRHLGRIPGRRNRALLLHDVAAHQARWEPDA